MRASCYLNARLHFGPSSSFRVGMCAVGLIEGCMQAAAIGLNGRHQARG
jgi:hypothetical protein